MTVVNDFIISRLVAWIEPSKDEIQIKLNSTKVQSK